MEIRASGAAPPVIRGLAGTAKTGDLSPAEAAKLKKAAQDFEAIVLRDVIKGMRQSGPAAKGLLSGTGQNLYQDMMDDELAKALARKGGLGLADVLVRGLTRHAYPQKNPSSSTASGPMTDATTLTTGEESPQ
jgi:flagellar protein FlgJ